MINVSFRDEQGEFSASLPFSPEVGDQVVYPDFIERKKRVARIRDRIWELRRGGWMLVLDLVS